jgi:hypothetical protein
MRWQHCRNRTWSRCRGTRPSEAPRGVNSESELSSIEEEIDNILRTERLKTEGGDENAVDAATLNVVAHRRENLIHDRRAILATRPLVAQVA